MPKGDYPRWMYGPDGQARIFQNKDEQIPPGWVDHPSKLGKKEKKDKKEKAANSSTKTSADDRAATIASLREAGVEISDNATDEEIDEAFNALTEQG